MKIRDNIYILTITILILTSVSDTLRAQVATYPYSCGFENGMDGWNNASGQSNNWIIGRGDAAHKTDETGFETGPKSAYEGNAFAYVNLFDKYTAKKPVVMTKTFDFTNLTNPILSMYIHNYWTTGEGAVIKVRCKETGDYENNTKTLITIANSKGDAWYKMNACLSEFAGNPSVDISIVLETDNGKQPNIAIDNIIVDDFVIHTECKSISCYGYRDGQITIKPSAGGPVYQYFLIDDASTPEKSCSRETTKVFPNLNHGIYHPKIQDSISQCVAMTPALKLEQPAEIKTEITIDDILCYGDKTGSITVTASQEDNDDNKFTFSINGDNNFRTSNKFEKLSGGKYDITVKNSKGCLSTPVTAEIGANVKLEIKDIEVQHITRCHGDKNGSIYVFADFGNNAPLEYSLDGGTTLNNYNEKFIELAAGTYTVTVLDRNKCKITWPKPIEITEPPLLELVDTTHTDVIGCYGDKNGTIEIKAKGGTGTLCTSVDGMFYDSITTHTNLAAGIYNLSVVDKNNCWLKLQNPIQIKQPEPLKLENVSITNVTTCNGDATGAIKITAQGGTAPITYHLNSDKGALDPITENTFRNLHAGEYVPYVSDSKGCTATFDPTHVNITEPQPFKMTSVTKMDSEIRCHGDLKGAIYAIASGGTLPYHYTIDNYAHTKTTENVETCGFTSIGAGTYTVKAKDAMNCTASETTVVLDQPDLLTIKSVEVSPLTCYKSQDGSISVIAEGGNMSYKYGYCFHGDNNYRVTTTQLIPNLAAEVYDISVTDGNGCTAYSYNHEITQPEELQITAITPHDVSICYGSNNGSITINAIGGVKPYQFSINDGVDFKSEGYFGNLPGGNDYSILVKDAHNCMVDGGSTLINQPAPVVIENIDYKDVVGCHGAKNGSITFIASGGSGELKYSITGHSAQPDGEFLNIPGGSYSLRVEDEHGCYEEHPGVVIRDPDEFKFTAETQLTHNQCFGDNNGTAIIHVEGGMPIQYDFPYKFFVNMPDDLTDGNPYCYDGKFSRLYAGEYNITIVDAYKCKLKTSFTITEPELFEITGLDTTNVNTCNGDATGRIKVNTTGGVQPVLFSCFSMAGYSEENDNGIFDGLKATQYEINAEDGNGCKSTSYANLEQPEPVTLKADLTKEIRCHDAGQGEIEVSAYGGVSHYSVSLDDGKTYPYSVGKIGDLSAGTYTITVKDGNNCVAKGKRVIQIQNPPQLSITTTASDVICHEGNTGKIISQVSGGTSPYSYSLDNTKWEFNQTVFDNLTDGTYTVYVKDIYDCKIQSQPLTIRRPENKAGFTISETEGCSPFTITLTQQYPGLTSYSISNGDKIFDKTGPTTHTIVNNTGTVQKYEILSEIRYDQGGGCFDTTYRYVTVYPQPRVDFRLADTSAVWPNNTALIANLSKDIVSAHWDFGDGTTSNDFGVTSHQYPTCGYYNIILIESDGRCSDTLERSFSIEGREILPAFTTSANDGCEPVTITFNNASNNADSLVWDFGDGTSTISNSQNVRHTYSAPGTYDATLTLYGDCGATTSMSKTITVFPKPTAAFQQNLDTVYAEQLLRVYCESSPTDHYIWDFGDGTRIDGLATAEHDYKFDGTFDISLIVVSGHSCSDTAKVKKAVTVVTTPVVVFPTAFTPNGDGLNDLFMPVHGIVTTYDIVILNRNGVVVFRSNKIDEGWDGTRNGQPCLPGMYVYKVRTTLRDKTIHYQYGHVMLYR